MMFMGKLIKLYKVLPFFLLAGIILASGCTTETENQMLPKPSLPNMSVIGQTSYTIEITSAGFSPNTLTIKTGDSIIFLNTDSNQHWPASAFHPTHAAYDSTTLSEHCPNPDMTAFDACHGLEQGETFTFRFNKTGRWGYHDHLNPSHTGTIVVE